MLAYVKTSRTTNRWITDIVSGSDLTAAAAYWEALGVFSTGRKPTVINFRGDYYLAGAYSRVVVRHHQDRRFLPAGIKPPSQKVTVAAGSGSGGDSGNAIMFITFLHKVGDAILAESDPSNYVIMEGVTGTGYAWSSIQNTLADLRVTHVRGYRSMNGGDFRMAWEAPFGITAYEENLSENGLLHLGPVNHGVPPTGIFYATEWSGRIWYARNSEFPYRLWYSEPGQPQYVGAISYRDTPDRSTITAIARGKNELLVFTRRSCFRIRGSDQGSVDSDFVMERLDSTVGCICHWGIQEIHNRLWFPAEDGIWIYDGSFYYAMRDLRPLWRADYKANQIAFQQGFGGHDIEDKTYVFFTPRLPSIPFEGEGTAIPEGGEETGATGSIGTVRYVGEYENFERSMGGVDPQPNWELDLLFRRDSSVLYNEDGDLLIGSCDGQIRKKDSTDGDDDGDGYGKKLILEHGHMTFFDVGGDVQDGKTVGPIWLFIESEASAWALMLKAGDEDAYRQIEPSAPDDPDFCWRADVSASELTGVWTSAGGTDYNVLYAAESVHFFKPNKVTGRGVTPRIVGTNPIGFKYRGLGGFWGPGVAHRPIVTATAVPPPPPPVP